MTLSRRDWLVSTVSTIGLLGASSAFGQVAGICSKTPDQPEGPFYPISDQPDKNSDLTYVDGRSGHALGKTIYLSGIVSDADCKPVQNVVVEIWQACATGRYNHPGDVDNASALDPNFQYWGITTSNERGEYSFKTILPGHYLASPTWMRPSHIHFKVHKRGYHELTTQMYFAGNEYNAGDLILNKLSDEEKNAVVVQMTSHEGINNEFDCMFNIMVKKVL